MAKNVVVLGGGTAGTAVANRLRRLLPAHEADITVIDQDSKHWYQPGLLFAPFGTKPVDRLQRNRWAQLLAGVGWQQAGVDHVDPAGSAVTLHDGGRIDYDVLVLATGARLLPDETEGLTGEGWGENVFTFYSPEGAAALNRRLRHVDCGRLVVNVADMPIKCPVAPLEFCFLADAYFRRRGIRDRIELVYATPLDAAFTKPIAASKLAGLLDRKGIELVTEFNTGNVDSDGERGKLTSYDGRDIPFDLAVVVPIHGGAEYVGRSPGLGDPLDFVMTDPETLQAKAAPNVFALGDATDLATSKAGSVAHFQSEVVAENIAHYLRDEPLDATYDGHANCFIETGGGKALLIDFNTEIEPVPGHYPTSIGLPLLRESRLNHLGKLAFEQIYWRVLLPGHSIPKISPAMPLAGKDLSALHRKDQP
jgi:sulfide:quinone oxidoreductase